MTFFILLLLLDCLALLNGHSIYMTYKGSYCDTTPLTLGTTIMSSTIVPDTLGRTISVSRNGVKLNSGSYFIPGETLVVTVTPFSLEVVLEARGKYEKKVDFTL